MTNQLKSARNDKEILEYVACLYTAESFLYKLINSTLRNKDMSKLHNLGPFSYLLSHYLEQNEDRLNKIVYRSANLIDDMIEEYKQAVGKHIVWHSFISTSEDIRVVKQFGVNTIFIISLTNPAWWVRRNVSSLSHYPHEQEVLLHSHQQYTVDKITQDSENGKYSIYMTLY